MFYIKINEKIAAIVTIRREKTRELHESDLRVKENELRTKNFSYSGNFGFGIEEHIEEVRTSYLLIEIKYLLIQTKISLVFQYFKNNLITFVIKLVTYYLILVYWAGKNQSFEIKLFNFFIIP